MLMGYCYKRVNRRKREAKNEKSYTILLAGRYWATNIGNVFYEIGAKYLFKHVGRDIDLSLTSNFAHYYWNRYRSEGNSFEPIRHSFSEDIDYLVWMGPVFDTYVQKAWDAPLRRANENVVVPDCVRAALRGEKMVVRNPQSIRPYQHVLEPVFAYLMIAAKQYEDKSYDGCYNVGPDEQDCWKTGDLVDAFAGYWGEGLQWVQRGDASPHEATFLRLDCSKIKTVFGWRPCWDLAVALQKVVEWTKCWRSGKDVRDCMNMQIEEFKRAGR